MKIANQNQLCKWTRICK